MYLFWLVTVPMSPSSHLLPRCSAHPPHKSTCSSWLLHQHAEDSLVFVSIWQHFSLPQDHYLHQKTPTWARHSQPLLHQSLKVDAVLRSDASLAWNPFSGVSYRSWPWLPQRLFHTALESMFPLGFLSFSSLEMDGLFEAMRTWRELVWENGLD